MFTLHAHYTLNQKPQSFPLETVPNAALRHAPQLEIQTPSTLSRVYYLLTIDAPILAMHTYQSSWGQEFEPLSLPVDAPTLHQQTSGRPTNGGMPFWSIELEAGTLAIAFGWGGNWGFTYHPGTPSTLQITLEHPAFQTSLEQGEAFRFPPLYIAHEHDAEACALAIRQCFRSARTPQPPCLAQAFVAWNSWWPYEDKRLNEARYLEQLSYAQTLGITDSLLDSGWYGAPGLDHLPWGQRRGDWHLTDPQRFPSGIPDLHLKVQALGLRSGIWCEIETIDPLSQTAQAHPDFLARDASGAPLNYACFGYRPVRDWAEQTVARLIAQGATWLKFDFNEDPHLGCQAPDHDHGSQDGLYAHVLGFRSLLTSLRERYPDVLFENCSSGGLRLDIGTAEATSLSFLSDPDYTEHHLQVLWGALSYLDHRSLYHFVWSDTLGEHNLENHPIEPSTPPDRIRYMMRACFIGRFALGWELSRLSDEQRHVAHTQILLYHHLFPSHLQGGIITRLTPQPLRQWRGERCPAFLVTPNEGPRLLLAFRLPGGSASRTYTIPSCQSAELLDSEGCTVSLDGSDVGVSFPTEECAALVLLHS